MQDLTEMRFGRWLVVSYAGAWRWNCQCDCGTQKAVEGSSLRLKKSTGCLKCRTPSAKRHGESKTRLHTIWEKMKARCGQKNDAAYHRYGGRGISVCPEWADNYSAFAAWARSNGYDEHLTIDRIDNNSGYCPKNCRWATYAQQNRNYSRNRPVFYNGQWAIVGDLAVAAGMSPGAVRQRVFRYGWSIDDALSKPVRARRKGVALTFERVTP